MAATPSNPLRPARATSPASAPLAPPGAWRTPRPGTWARSPGVTHPAPTPGTAWWGECGVLARAGGFRRPPGFGGARGLHLTSPLSTPTPRAAPPPGPRAAGMPKVAAASQRSGGGGGAAGAGGGGGCAELHFLTFAAAKTSPRAVAPGHRPHNGCAAKGTELRPSQASLSGSPRAADTPLPTRRRPISSGL